MKQRLELAQKRSLFILRLRVATFRLLRAMSFLLLAKMCLTSALAQVTRVPPFVGTHSETWEHFGQTDLPAGTSILGGIATISGNHMVIERTFQMCTVFARPSDGVLLMDSDRPSGPMTIHFSQPVTAFGAYWGSGLHCGVFGFPDSPSILTFQDLNGDVVGTDSFLYRGDGTLMWRGYRFGTPVKTITRRAGDGEEGVAVDGLRAIVAGSPLSAGATQFDFNNDDHPDFVLYNAATGRTVVWYMNNNIHLASHNGPTLPSGWSMAAVADFNGDGHPDYLLYNASTHDTVIWYLVGATFLSGNHGPHVPSDWQVVAASDFDGNGSPDLVLYRPSTRKTVIWYMNKNERVGGATGPTIVSGWSVVTTADFDEDGHPDYLLFKPSTGQSVIWYLSGVTRSSSRSGPTIPTGYVLVGAADFDGNDRPDYVLYNSSTQQTAIWYLNNNVLGAHLAGPTLPNSWSLIAP